MSNKKISNVQKKKRIRLGYERGYDVGSGDGLMGRNRNPERHKPKDRFYEEGFIRGYREGYKGNLTREEGLKTTLESYLVVLLSILSLIASLMFFSTNLTGLVISNLNNTDTNIVGVILFAAGILLILLNFRIK